MKIKFYRKQIEICNYRPQTYATKKGLEYIRKMLAKDNKLCTD